MTQEEIKQEYQKLIGEKQRIEAEIEKLKEKCPHTKTEIISGPYEVNEIITISRQLKQKFEKNCIEVRCLNCNAKFEKVLTSREVQ